MRSLLMVLAACGPMYAQPGGQQPPSPAADPVSGPAPVSAPAPAPVSAAAPASAPGADPVAARTPAGSIAQRFVDAHNRARAKHCAGKLTWSPKLASYAQKWADTLKAKGCAFGHSGGQYGENLAAGTEGVLDPEATVAMWYDEIKLYKFPDGGFSMQTGHFTQLVWRTTTQVGCGHAQCKGNDIWVCEYDPPGNYDGEYRQNVLPAGCK
jgi:pathogenesis-related protein 1